MNSFLNDLLVLEFLSDIDSKILAFCGGIPIILLFGLFNRKSLVISTFFISGLFIYVLSIGTALGIDGLGWLGDRACATIAGFWAPLTYSLLLSIIIVASKQISSNKDDIDHFIEH